MKYLFNDLKKQRFTIHKILEFTIIRERIMFEGNKSINVTTVIHINHINFAIETIEENYFGVGFQNYGIYNYTNSYIYIDLDWGYFIFDNT